MALHIPRFEGARVLVIGDIMLDRYWTGPTSRISPEAPVPVVRVVGTDDRLGGAANVARNLSALGCQTTVCGIVGDDENAAAIRHLLTENGIRNTLTIAPRTPTITKLRVVSRHQQLIRLDFEEPLRDIDRTPLLSDFTAQLGNIDVVVISDYAKGTVIDAEPFIDACHDLGIPILVDPKGGNFSHYRHASVLTPNLSELEAIVGTTTSVEDACEKADELRHHLGLEALLLTLSEKGMALIQADQPPLLIPAQARDVFDVTGAGDTVVATVAASLASGSTLADATRLANVAAGIVVGKLGTAVVTPDELYTAITSDHAQVETGVMTLAELEPQIRHCRGVGEAIVFTNGCFDILHAGHVAYLEKAAALGDRLVVAVNTDESVTRLKGPTRPIVPLPERMAVLAGLRCVDWVVPFAEDTPAQLIDTLVPNFLVKGGDYEPKAIVGYDTVIEHGGEVVVMPFTDGSSTSNIVETIIRRHKQE